MKKVLVMAIGIMVACGSSAIAQKDTTAKPAVENTCKNKVQVTDLSGTQQAGSQSFEYFLQLKNVTNKQLYVDLQTSESDKFPHGTRVYSTHLKNIKIKAGKNQTIRLANGTRDNMSVGLVKVEVDEFKEDKKKPTIAIMNCREKK